MCNSQLEKPKWKMKLSSKVSAMEVSTDCRSSNYKRDNPVSRALMNWGFAMVVKNITNKLRGSIQLKDTSVTSLCCCRSRLSRTVVKRRRGIPWTAEEHRSFIQGLGELGKGDWRGISRKFVFYRSPTQVASQAQKLYKRLHDNDNSKKKRSIHDITGVGAAGITEPSQGQKSDELTGPCGVLQWPITDYVTDAFDTGILSVPGPVTNCTTDATEGPSAFNPEKSPLDAALVSELNSSFPGVDEFLQSVEDLITVPAEGTSGVCRGVDTRTSQSLNLQPSVVAGTGKYIHPVSVLAEGTSGVRRGVDTSTAPSFNLQPSVGGGTGTYTHPINNVGYDLEELMTKQLIGASQVGSTVNTASLQLPITDHAGFHGCTASSIDTKNDFASTKGAPEGVFSVNTMQFPSIPGSTGCGTYPCWYPSSNDDDIYDLEDL